MLAHTHTHSDMQMLSTKMECGKRRASRSKANALCKKHPKHRQSPGVCSICLNQKLSLLSNSNASSSTRSRSPSSLSSYVSSLSSSNASSYSSPVVDATRIFKKSRSMAFVSNKIGIVKGGFWSKLWPQKNTRILMHSRTVRERVVATLH